jgi:2-methylcitrate dehydratase PrpD
MRSADFAELGIGGRAETVYDVFVDCVGTNARVEALTEELGERWSVANGYHKVYACCGYAHSAVQATLELSERLGKRSVDDVADVIIETGPGGLALTTVEPETVLAAKFSVPHSVAATMVVKTAGRRAFTESTLDDSAIADIRRRVKLVPYPNLKPWPNDRPARVTWKFRDGEEWSAVCESARGGADQPFDDATLLLKLRVNAAEVFPELPDLAWKIVGGDTEMLGLSWRDAIARMVAAPKRTGAAA